MNTELITTYLAAKAAEDAWRDARIAAELALADSIPSTKDEGSTTAKDGAYKVTVTRTINRRIDREVLGAVRQAIPEALFDRAVRWKPDLDMAGVRYLQSNEPVVYAALAQAITAAPGKPSVKVELINTPV